MAPEEEDRWDRLIKVIGKLCIMWGQIDNFLIDIALHTAAALNPAFDRPDDPKPRPWDLLLSALCQMDERSKIATIKAYAHHINHPFSPDFYDRTAELLDYIDNVLRPERNRFVHDSWNMHDDGRVVRVQMGLHVRRPQSRQREVTLWKNRDYANVEEVEALNKNLDEVWEDLCVLDSHLAGLATYRDRPSARFQPLPRPWSCLAQRKMRDSEKRGRQPQSPPG
jgi:hypothetical protein